MVQMSLFAGRDRHADIENGHMDTVEGRERRIGRVGLT